MAARRKRADVKVTSVGNLKDLVLRSDAKRRVSKGGSRASFEALCVPQRAPQDEVDGDRPGAFPSVKAIAV
jgi:hypothetical protein